MNPMNPMNLFQGRRDAKNIFCLAGACFGRFEGSSMYIGSFFGHFLSKIQCLLPVWMNQMYIDEPLVKFKRDFSIGAGFFTALMNLRSLQKCIHVHLVHLKWRFIWA